MESILNQIHPGTDPGAWRAETEERARAAGLELTPAHWQVIEFLREQCDAERAPKAHLVAMALEERFAAEGGRRYLLELFPKGAVAQGCELAGLPVPAYASDGSFGTVM